MSQWKAILAALVIFGSGAIFGGLLVKTTMAPQKNPLKRKEPNAPTAWAAQRMEFYRRIEKELDLKPEQKQKIEEVFRASQERMKPFWEKISPQLHEEVTRVQNEIRVQLTPDQEKKFDELLKTKPPRKQEKAQEEKRRRKKETNTVPAEPVSTNQP